MPQEGRLNSSGLPQYHLIRNGPNATVQGVANIMDFHRVTTLIGRNRSQVDYVLDSSTYMRSAYISRNHARVVRQVNNSDAHRLFDDSLNGMFVNNLKIAGSVVLNEGDLVTFGHPNGSQVAPGVRCRQPNSEYQFLFERCDCRQPNNSALHPSDQGFAVPGRPSPTGKWIKKRDRNTTQSFTTEDVRKLRDSYQTVVIKGSQNDKTSASKETSTSTNKDDESADDELDYQNVLLRKSPEKAKKTFSNKRIKSETLTNPSTSSSDSSNHLVPKTDEKSSPKKDAAMQTSDAESDSQSQKCFKKYFAKKSPTKDASMQTSPTGVGNRNFNNSRSTSSELNTSSASASSVAMGTSLSENSKDESGKAETIQSIEMTEEQADIDTAARNIDVRNSGSQNGESNLEVDNDQERRPSAVTMETSVGQKLNSSDKQCETSITENKIDEDQKIDVALQIDNSVDNDTDDEEAVKTHSMIFSDSVDYPPEYYYDDSEEEFSDQEENTEINITEENRDKTAKENLAVNKDSGAQEISNVEKFDEPAEENKWDNVEGSPSDVQEISNVEKFDEPVEESVRSNITEENKIENVEGSPSDIQEMSNIVINHPSRVEVSEQNINAEKTESSSLTSMPVSSEMNAQVDVNDEVSETCDEIGSMEVSRLSEHRNMLEVLKAGEQIGMARLTETSGQTDMTKQMGMPRMAETSDQSDNDELTGMSEAIETSNLIGLVEHMPAVTETKEQMTEIEINEMHVTEHMPELIRGTESAIVTEVSETSETENVSKIIENNAEDITVTETFKKAGVSKVNENSKQTYMLEETETSVPMNVPKPDQREMDKVTKTEEVDTSLVTNKHTSLSDVCENNMVAEEADNNEISDQSVVAETSVCVMSENRTESDMSLHTEMDNPTCGGSKPCVSNQISTEVIASPKDYEKPFEQVESNLTLQNENSMSPVSKNIAALQEFNKHLAPLVKSSQKLSPASSNCGELSPHSKRKMDQAVISEMVSCLEESISSAGEISEDEDNVENMGEHLKEKLDKGENLRNDAINNLESNARNECTSAPNITEENTHQDMVGEPSDKTVAQSINKGEASRVEAENVKTVECFELDVTNTGEAEKMSESETEDIEFSEITDTGVCDKTDDNVTDISQSDTLNNMDDAEVDRTVANLSESSDSDTVDSADDVADDNDVNKTMSGTVENHESAADLNIITPSGNADKTPTFAGDITVTEFEDFVHDDEESEDILNGCKSETKNSMVDISSNEISNDQKVEKIGHDLQSKDNSPVKEFTKSNLQVGKTVAIETEQVEAQSDDIEQEMKVCNISDQIKFDIQSENKSLKMDSNEETANSGTSRLAYKVEVEAVLTSQLDLEDENDFEVLSQVFPVVTGKAVSVSGPCGCFDNDANENDFPILEDECSMNVLQTSVPVENEVLIDNTRSEDKIEDCDMQREKKQNACEMDEIESQKDSRQEVCMNMDDKDLDTTDNGTDKLIGENKNLQDEIPKTSEENNNMDTKANQNTHQSVDCNHAHHNVSGKELPVEADDRCPPFAFISSKYKAVEVNCKIENLQKKGFSQSEECIEKTDNIQINGSVSLNENRRGNIVNTIPACIEENDCLVTCEDTNCVQNSDGKISRKRRYSEVEISTGNEDIQKKPCVENEKKNSFRDDAKTVLSNFFRIRNSVMKDKKLNKQLLKRQLVGKIVKNFFKFKFKSGEKIKIDKTLYNLTGFSNYLNNCDNSNFCVSLEQTSQQTGHSLDSSQGETNDSQRSDIVANAWACESGLPPNNSSSKDNETVALSRNLNDGVQSKAKENFQNESTCSMKFSEENENSCIFMDVNDSFGHVPSETESMPMQTNSAVQHRNDTNSAEQNDNQNAPSYVLQVKEENYNTVEASEPISQKKTSDCNLEETAFQNTNISIEGILSQALAPCKDSQNGDSEHNAEEEFRNDSLYDDPSLSELMGDSEKDPSLSELIGDSEKDPSLSELMGDSEKDPSLSELIGDSEKDPSLSELIGDSEKDPSLSELIGDSEKDLVGKYQPNPNSWKLVYISNAERDTPSSYGDMSTQESTVERQMSIESTASTQYDSDDCTQRSSSFPKCSIEKDTRDELLNLNGNDPVNASKTENAEIVNNNNINSDVELHRKLPVTTAENVEKDSDESNGVETDFSETSQSLLLLPTDITAEDGSSDEQDMTLNEDDTTLDVTMDTTSDAHISENDKIDAVGKTFITSDFERQNKESADRSKMNDYQSSADFKANSPNMDAIEESQSILNLPSASLNCSDEEDTGTESEVNTNTNKITEIVSETTKEVSAETDMAKIISGQINMNDEGFSEQNMKEDASDDKTRKDLTQESEVETQKAEDLIKTTYSSSSIEILSLESSVYESQVSDNEQNEGPGNNSNISNKENGESVYQNQVSDNEQNGASNNSDDGDKENDENDYLGEEGISQDQELDKNVVEDSEVCDKIQTRPPQYSSDQDSFGDSDRNMGSMGREMDSSNDYFRLQHGSHSLGDSDINTGSMGWEIDSSNGYLRLQHSNHSVNYFDQDSVTDSELLRCEINTEACSKNDGPKSQLPEMEFESDANDKTALCKYEEMKTSIFCSSIENMSDSDEDLPEVTFLRSEAPTQKIQPVQVKKELMSDSDCEEKILRTPKKKSPRKRAKKKFKSPIRMESPDSDIDRERPPRRKSPKKKRKIDPVFENSDLIIITDSETDSDIRKHKATDTESSDLVKVRSSDITNSSAGAGSIQDVFNSEEFDDNSQDGQPLHQVKREDISELNNGDGDGDDDDDDDGDGDGDGDGGDGDGADSCVEETYNEGSDQNDDGADDDILQQETQYYGSGTPRNRKSCPSSILSTDVDNDNNVNDETCEIENESNMDGNTPDILDILNQDTQYVGDPGDDSPTLNSDNLQNQNIKDPGDDSPNLDSEVQTEYIVDPGDDSPSLNTQVVQRIVETCNMTYSQICREITGETENDANMETSKDTSHETSMISEMSPSVDTDMDNQTFDKDDSSVIRREDAGTPLCNTTDAVNGTDEEYVSNTCDSESEADFKFPELKSLSRRLNSTPSPLSLSKKPIKDKNQNMENVCQDAGNPGSRLLDMEFSYQSDDDFSPPAVNMAALGSDSEQNDKTSDINFDDEPVASTSRQSEGVKMDRSKKRRFFDNDEMDNNRFSSPKKRSKSGDAVSTSTIVDIESLEKVRSPLSDIEDYYTESNMADTQFAESTSNFMQDIDKKSKLSRKTKAQELLAKLKAKKDRFKKQEPAQRETTSLQIAEENTDDAGPSSRMSHRTEAEQTNDNIEGYIARCKEVVCQLKNSFNSQQSLRNNPRIIQWKKEAEELDTKIKLPQTVIAVVGDTGCGKSSLMNALIDQLDVLPTSGVRACTAVVVEITDNKLNDMFEADVQFLSRKEWHDELKLLLTDLTGADGKIKKNVPDPQSEAGVAYLKIKAVYGRIDTFEALSRCNTVTRWLDRTKTISSGNAREFRRAIDKFIETADPGSGGQYWPIVKLVTMRIPNCDVCSSGAVLVDLPGVRDSNAARDKIARDYLKKCTTVWVVSSIHRAIDDKTAKDLLGENFRRQLLMDGQYGSIAFICTKSDILVPSEIIQGLKLHDQTDPLENEIRGLQMEKADADLLVANADSEMTQMRRNMEKLENEITEMKGDIQELQDLNDSVDQDDDCEIQQQIKEFKEIIASKEEAIRVTQSDMKERKIAKNDANRRSLEIDREMIVKRKKIATICAQGRNEYARREIKRDFKAGLREMKRKAGMTAEEEEEDIPDDYDSDNDDEDIGSSASNLKVFCVSSVEYQKIKKILANNGPPVVFNKMEDTEILALRRYVHEMTLIRRSQGTERTIRNVSRFVFDIQNYLMDNGTECKGTRLNARSTIEGRSSELQDRILPVIQRLTNDIDTAFSGSIKPKIQDGVTSACSSAVEIQGKWARKSNKENRREGGLHWMTYKATVRRQGVYTSPTYGAIDMNEALSEPLYRSITITWDKVFSGMLWNALETCRSMLLAVLKQFTTELCEELHSLGVPNERTKRVLGHLLGSASNKLSEMVNYLKEFITTSQRDINRVLTPAVQDNLNNTYDRCASESGTGMFVRMKECMSTGVDLKRYSMFDEASNKLLKDLLDLQTQIIDHVNLVCKELCNLIETSFEPLWEAPINTKILREALFESITNISMTMNSLQEEANIPPLERQVVPSSEDSVSVSTASNLSSVPRVASEVNVSTTSITPIVAQGVSRREQNTLNARFGQRPALYPSTSTPRIKQEPVDEEERMDTSYNNTFRSPYEHVSIKHEPEDESINYGTSSSVVKQHTVITEAGSSTSRTVQSSHGPSTTVITEAGPSHSGTVKSHGQQNIATTNISTSESLQNSKNIKQSMSVASDSSVSQNVTLTTVSTQVYQLPISGSVSMQVSKDKTDTNHNRHTTNSPLGTTTSDASTGMPKLVSNPRQQVSALINKQNTVSAGEINNIQRNAVQHFSRTTTVTETMAVKNSTVTVGTNVPVSSSVKNMMIAPSSSTTQMSHGVAMTTTAGINNVNDIVNPRLSTVGNPGYVVVPTVQGNLLLSSNGTQYLVPVTQMGQAVTSGMSLSGSNPSASRALVSLVNQNMPGKQTTSSGAMILPNTNRLVRPQVNNQQQIQATQNRIVLPGGIVYHQWQQGSIPNMTLPRQTTGVPNMTSPRQTTGVPNMTLPRQTTHVSNMTVPRQTFSARKLLYTTVPNISGKASATITKPSQTSNVDSMPKMSSVPKVHQHPNLISSQPSSSKCSEQTSNQLVQKLTRVNEPEKHTKIHPITSKQTTVVVNSTGQPSVIGQSFVHQQVLIGQSPVQQQPVIGQPSVNQQPVIGQPSVNQQPVIGQSSVNQQPVIGQPSVNQQPVIGQPSVKHQSESAKSTTVLSTITNTTKNLLNKGLEKSVKSILNKPLNDNHSREINSPTVARSSVCDSPSTKTQAGNKSATKANKLSLSLKRNTNSPKLSSQPQGGTSTDAETLYRRTLLSVKQEPGSCIKPKRKIRTGGFIDLTKSSDEDTDSE